MGKEIANAFPPLLESFEKIDIAFEKEGKERLTKTIFPIPVFNKAAEKAQQVELTKTQMFYKTSSTEKKLIVFLPYCKYVSINL